MDVWFPLNNPIKPCSVLDKICWYTATSKSQKSYLSLKRQMWKTEHVSMDVMSLDTNIEQNEGILKLSVAKHMKISTKTTHSYTLIAGIA